MSILTIYLSYVVTCEDTKLLNDTKGKHILQKMLKKSGFISKKGFILQPDDIFSLK